MTIELISSILEEPIDSVLFRERHALEELLAVEGAIPPERVVK